MATLMVMPKYAPKRDLSEKEIVTALQGLGCTDCSSKESEAEMNEILMQTFALLVFGHALADYPLQGDFLSRAKNHTAPISGVPWYQALAAHCVIHAGFVGIITGSMVLAVAELIVHAVIDHAKCSGQFGFNADQALHVIFKAVWVFWIWQVTF